LDRLAEIPKNAEWRRFWSISLNEIKHLKTAPRIPAGATEPVYGYAITTLRSVLSDYRNAVRKDLRFGPNHPVLKYLKPSVDDQDVVKDMGVQRVYDANVARRPVDPDDLVDQALELLSASNALLRGAALLLLTGRRNIELFRGELSPTPKRKHSELFDGAEGNTLFFSGQAKTRGAESAQTTPFEIPVLGDAPTILRAYRRMQSDYPIPEDYTNKQIDSRIASTLAQHVRQYFRDDAGGSLVPKDLRAIYATIAYDWYAPPGFSLNAYFGRILGHSEYDVITSMSYNRFYVAGHKRDYDRAFRKATREAIEQLRQRQLAELDEAKRKKIAATIAEYESYIPHSY
jgi:hypothetical protein